MNENNANFTPAAPNFKTLVKMSFQGLTNFPYIEEDFDALTNYGLLSKVVEYLNEVISNNNEQNTVITNLYNAYVSLQNYVNDYFDNLDVQDEINNKLDDMVKSGELQQLLKLQYNELENEVDEKFDILTNALNDKLDEQDLKINNATSGSPLVASSTSGMTDTSRIYVNTTDGKWYYYNGSAWTIGGTYQGTSVSESDPTIAELNARLNQYMQYYYFNESSSFNTPFSLKTGQKLHIVITSINNVIVPFTVGYTQDSYGNITTVGTHVKTVSHDGAMRFYFSTEGNVQGYCYIENELKNQINTNNNNINELKYNYIENSPSINSIQLKKKKVYDNFDNLTNKTYTFNSSSTIENYANYETASSVSLPTPPIRVRDNLGNLLYNNLTITNYDDIGTEDARCIYTFGKDGKYLREFSFKNLKLRGQIIADDEYYVILNKFPTVSGYAKYDWILNDIRLDWFNNTENGKEVYYVGQGKDYTTFTEMLEDLQDNENEKIVYIDPGTYDIFTELGGAEYMESLLDTAGSLNWRDVNYVVPPNTTIIGIGEVNLTWNATPEQMYSQAIAFLFSPLNVSGSCTIENINVIGKNCRYAVHDETSGLEKYNGAIHIFKNCKFQLLNSTYGVYMTYGAGHNRNMKIKFDNCTFINYGQALWSSHDWNYPANSPALFEMNNCIFTRENENLTNGYVRFSSADKVGKKDIVKINNCYINGHIAFSTEGTSNVKQGYDVTLIGSSHVDVTYGEHVTERWGVKQYNSFK